MGWRLPVEKGFPLGGVWITFREGISTGWGGDYLLRRDFYWVGWRLPVEKGFLLGGVEVTCRAALMVHITIYR